MTVSSFELLEGTGSRLSVYSGDGEGFVAAFRLCWGRLPELDRQHLLDYWAASAYSHLPAFELSNLWPDEVDAHAQVTEAGYQLRFNAASFGVLPQEVALFIIAHELGHVYRWANGNRQFDEPESVVRSWPTSSPPSGGSIRRLVTG